MGRGPPDGIQVERSAQRNLESGWAGLVQTKLLPYGGAVICTVGCRQTYHITVNTDRYTGQTVGIPRSIHSAHNR